MLNDFGLGYNLKADMKSDQQKLSHSQASVLASQVPVDETNIEDIGMMNDEFLKFNGFLLMNSSKSKRPHDTTV